MKTTGRKIEFVVNCFTVSTRDRHKRSEKNFWVPMDTGYQPNFQGYLTPPAWELILGF